MSRKINDPHAARLRTLRCNIQYIHRLPVEIGAAAGEEYDIGSRRAACRMGMAGGHPRQWGKQRQTCQRYETGHVSLFVMLSLRRDLCQSDGMRKRIEPRCWSGR
jgi:hypothetical protein